MKQAILAVALLPLTLSANVAFESTKKVDREIVVIFKEKSNINNDIIESVVENERNRFSLHFATFTGEDVDSGSKSNFIEQVKSDKTGIIKPDVTISDLVYEVKPCTKAAAMIINAVCVNYKANVELTISRNAFMEEGEIGSFNGRLSKASRLLLKRDD